MHQRSISSTYSSISSKARYLGAGCFVPMQTPIRLAMLVRFIIHCSSTKRLVPLVKRHQLNKQAFEWKANRPLVTGHLAIIMQDWPTSEREWETFSPGRARVLWQPAQLVGYSEAGRARHFWSDKQTKHYRHLFVWLICLTSYLNGTSID